MSLFCLQHPTFISESFCTNCGFDICEKCQELANWCIDCHKVINHSACFNCVSNYKTDVNKIPYKLATRRLKYLLYKLTTPCSRSSSNFFSLINHRETKEFTSWLENSGIFISFEVLMNQIENIFQIQDKLIQREKLDKWKNDFNTFILPRIISCSSATTTVVDHKWIQENKKKCGKCISIWFYNLWKYNSDCSIFSIKRLEEE